MSKGTNIRNKKLHSAKPYEVSTSFVKKVTSGVSSLLPPSSWLTRWFTSSSILEDDKNKLTDGVDHIHTTSEAPPAKHARIPLNRSFPPNSFHVSSPVHRGEIHLWSGESVTAPASNSGRAGPSCLGRTSGSTGSFYPPNTSTECLEGKLNGDGGSDSSESTSGSLLPPMALSSSDILGASNSKSSLGNHMQSSHFSPTLHKPIPALRSMPSQGRPSLNISSFGTPILDSSKLTQESSLSSPFYKGRTMYGGASAYRRPRAYMATHEPLTMTRRGVQVRPVDMKCSAGASAEASMSHSAKRILEAIEYFSTPASDARRMPLSETLRMKRVKNLATVNLTPGSVLPAAATSGLTIPISPDRLRLHRLQDATEAARRVADSMPSQHYSLRAADDGQWRSQTGKVTKSKPINEEDLPASVDLPNVSLSITTLPSFSFFSPLVKSTPNNTVRSQANAPFGKSKKLMDLTDVLTSDKASASSRISGGLMSNIAEKKDSKNFSMFVAHDNAFSGAYSEKPSSHLNFSYSPTSVKINSHLFLSRSDNSCAPQKNEKRINVVETSNSVITGVISTFKDKHSFCFSHPKSIGIGNEEIPSVKAYSFDFAQPDVLDVAEYYNIVKHSKHNGFHKHAGLDLQDKGGSVLVLNSACLLSLNEQEKKCDVSVQIGSGVPGLKENIRGAKFAVLPQTWGCSTCMIRNKMETVFCVCCGTKKPGAVAATKEKREVSLPDSADLKASWGNEFKLQPDLWECTTCLVRNKKSDTNCIACSTSQGGITAVISCPPLSGEALKSRQSENERWGAQFQLQPGIWECSTCLVHNKESESVCVACTAARPGALSQKIVSVKPQKLTSSGVAMGFDDKLKKSSVSWECPVCMIQNKNTSMKCAACQETKPGTGSKTSSFGSSMKFNFDMPSGISGFKFGIDKANDYQVPGNCSGGFSFGTPSVTSSGSSVFGFSSTVTNNGFPCNFSFGVPSSKVPDGVAASAESTSVSSVLTVTTADATVTSTALMDKPLPLVDSKFGSVNFGIPAKNSIEEKSAPLDDATDSKFRFSYASPSINNGAKSAVLDKSRAVPKIEYKLDHSEERVIFNLGVQTQVQPVVCSSATFAFTSSAPASTSVPISACTASSTTPYSSGGSSKIDNLAKRVNFGTSVTAKTSEINSSSFSFATSVSQSPAEMFAFSSPQPVTFQQSSEGLFRKPGISSSKSLFGGSSNTLPFTGSIFGGSSTSERNAESSTSNFGSSSDAGAAATAVTSTASTITIGFGRASGTAFGFSKTSGTPSSLTTTQGNSTNSPASKASVFSFGSKCPTDATTRSSSATGNSSSFGTFSAGGNNTLPIFGNSGTVDATSGSVFGTLGCVSSVATTSVSTFGGSAGNTVGSFCPSFNLNSGEAVRQFHFGSSSQASSTQLTGSHSFSFSQPQVSSNFSFSCGETPQPTTSGATTQRRMKRAVRRANR